MNPNRLSNSIENIIKYLNFLSFPTIQLRLPKIISLNVSPLRLGLKKFLWAAIKLGNFLKLIKI